MGDGERKCSLYSAVAVSEKAMIFGIVLPLRESSGNAAPKVRPKTPCRQLAPSLQVSVSRAAWPIFCLSD
eukprot:6200985-Pleurochrysis_carterae.AAC.5